MLIKILTTGLSGLVGSRIAELLGNKYQFAPLSYEDGVDITKPETLQKAIKQHKGAKVFLHLAAYTDVDGAWRQKGDKNGPCYKINVDGTKNIVKYCQKYGFYLIHISTDFVFDGKNPPKGGYSESDKAKPIEWYGQTKYLAEKEVEELESPFCILRIAFPYKKQVSPKEQFTFDSRGAKQYKSDILRKLKDKLLSGQELSLFTDQFICPTFIDDIASAVDRLSETRDFRGVLHCVGSDSVSPYSLAEFMVNEYGIKNAKIKAGSLLNYMQKKPTARPYQIRLVLNNKKLYNIFGIKTVGVKEFLSKHADRRKQT